MLAGLPIALGSWRSLVPGAMMTTPAGNLPD